jgi:hypothetical protein
MKSNNYKVKKYSSGAHARVVTDQRGSQDVDKMSTPCQNPSSIVNNVNRLGVNVNRPILRCQ